MVGGWVTLKTTWKTQHYGIVGECTTWKPTLTPNLQHGAHMPSWGWGDHMTHGSSFAGLDCN
jgi:hypothetical protein